MREELNLKNSSVKFFCLHRTFGLWSKNLYFLYKVEPFRKICSLEMVASISEFTRFHPESPGFYNL
jgi:hypothetical protein